MWKDFALSLFYEEGLKVVEISRRVGKSKQAVAKFLSQENPEKYKEEKERRKGISRGKEKIRKRNWKRENYESSLDIEYVLLRVQHDQDASFLSTRNNSSALGLWESGYIRSAYEQKGKFLNLKEQTEDGAAIPYGLPKRI